MVDDDRYCIDILTQISAAQAALDKIALGLLDAHAHTCVVGADPGQQDERTEEMMAAVGIYSLFALGLGMAGPVLRLADVDPADRDAVRSARVR